MTTTIKENIVDIENVCFWLRESPSIRSDVLVPPVLESIIGNVKNKKVLDIGCGNGYFTERIANKCAHVIGIDKSKFLTKIIIRENQKAKYENIDICKLPTVIGDIKKGYFDKAYASMSLLCLDSKQLLQAYQNIYDALKISGTITVATINPSRSVADFEKNRKESYFNSKKESCILRNTLGETINYEYYHHPLSTYINCATKAGFKLNNFIEIKPTQDDYSKYGKSLEIVKDISQYIIMNFVK